MIYESKHGGEIYDKTVDIDFSANINPLGMPKNVVDTLRRDVENYSRYPDMYNRELISKIAENKEISEDFITCGNGASEIFMAIAHGQKPSNVLLIAPSFLGYEHALKAVDANIIYYDITKKNFMVDCDIIDILTKDIDMIFIANPNNPTGMSVKEEVLINILEHCKNNDIILLADECFIELSDNVSSMIKYVNHYDNLIVVNAFTKTYAIAGIRLGYMICSNSNINNDVRKHLPEWNVSYVAQKTGAACLEEKNYVEKSKECIKVERMYMISELKKLGLEVYDSCTNFIFFRSNYNIYEELLKYRILIRDCSNYPGLTKGYYRIAVKKHEENVMLIKCLREQLIC